MASAFVTSIVALVLVVAFVLIITGLIGQAMAGRRLDPETRAALWAAWDDIHETERRIGLQPTDPPWWLTFTEPRGSSRRG